MAILFDKEKIAPTTTTTTITIKNNEETEEQRQQKPCQLQSAVTVCTVCEANR